MSVVRKLIILAGKITFMIGKCNANYNEFIIATIYVIEPFKNIFITT